MIAAGVCVITRRRLREKNSRIYCLLRVKKMLWCRVWDGDGDYDDGDGGKRAEGKRMLAVKKKKMREEAVEAWCHTPTPA